MENKTCIDNLVHTSENIVYPLPLSTCNLSAIKSAYNLSNHNEVVTFLGENLNEVSYWDINHNSEDGSTITVWQKGGELLKIDHHKIWYDEEMVSSLITKLGIPDKKLDYYRGVVTMKHKAWIYSDKGIALFLGRSENNIYSISYFNITSLENYENGLHPTQREREFE